MEPTAAMSPTTAFLRAANAPDAPPASPPPPRRNPRLQIFADWLTAAVAHSGDKELSLRQLTVLLTVHQGGANTVGVLATAMGIGKAGITRAFDALETLGLARRRVSESDRRIVHLVLTEAGQVFVAALEQRLRWVPAGEG